MFSFFRREFTSAEFILEPCHECIPKEGLLEPSVLSEVFPSLEPLRATIVRKLARRGNIRDGARHEFQGGPFGAVGS